MADKGTANGARIRTDRLSAYDWLVLISVTGIATFGIIAIFMLSVDRGLGIIAKAFRDGASASEYPGSPRCLRVLDEGAGSSDDGGVAAGRHRNAGTEPATVVAAAADG